MSEEWRDFQVFLSDMGPKPYPKAELDRVDNSRGYSKDNCRWVSSSYNKLSTRTRAGRKSKGVTRDTRVANGWYVTITYKGKHNYIGYYHSEEEAIEGYKQANLNLLQMEPEQ